MAFLHKIVALFVLIAISLSFLAQPAEAKYPLITNKVTPAQRRLASYLTGSDC